MSIVLRPVRASALLQAAALLLGFIGLRAHAAFDAFLRFADPAGGAPAVKGESADPQFPGSDGWFEISSFDEGILNPVTIGSGAGGAGAGKAKFQDFVFAKLVDSASPALFQATSVGSHYGRVQLSLRQAGARTARAPFYTAEMQTVFVSSVKWSAKTGDDSPMELVDVVFGALEWTYTRFAPNGAVETAFTVNWDQIHNQGGDGPISQASPPTLAYPGPQSVAFGGSLTVSPSSGPSDSAGIASVELVSAGSYAGGILVDPVTGAVQLTGAKPSGGPFTISVRALANDGETTDASFQVSVGTPPPLTANPDSLSRVLGRSMKIPIATLLANDSAGAVFGGLPSTDTALHGKVTVDGSVIVYDPPFPDPGGNDSFAYTIQDGSGGNASGNVVVSVSGPGGQPTFNLIISVSSAGNTIQLVDVPGRDYQLQTSSSASGPWTNFGGPVTADGNGSATWNDPSPDSPRFYRAYQAP